MKKLFTLIAIISIVFSFTVARSFQVAVDCSEGFPEVTRIVLHVNGEKNIVWTIDTSCLNCKGIYLRVNGKLNVPSFFKGYKFFYLRLHS